MDTTSLAGQEPTEQVHWKDHQHELTTLNGTSGNFCNRHGYTHYIIANAISEQGNVKRTIVYN